MEKLNAKHAKLIFDMCRKIAIPKRIELLKKEQKEKNKE